MGLIICIVILAVSFFFIFYAMVGYPAVILLLGKLKKPAKIKKDSGYEPTVSYMIVAHNEEKVILNKLNNALELDYKKDKLQIIIASDFSTDKTNEIVKNFIESHPELNIILHETVEHKGKTNAQNEAQKLAAGEILVMTDANAYLAPDAVKELVSCFADKDVSYVCGKLTYSNNENDTAASESSYWNLELKIRDIESRLQTITAGNGSLYAVRNAEYILVPLSNCHDDMMPYRYALRKKKALFNPDAVSYEKAGENNKDEFKRKVRMNRTILDIFVKMWRPLNIFRYKWFSVFYFGHRTCRYLLWLNHLIFFMASVALTAIGYYIAGGVLVGLQLFAILLGLISVKHTVKFKLFRMLGYYSMTILAQMFAALKQMAGKSKPTWEKADSTR